MLAHSGGRPLEDDVTASPPLVREVDTRGTHCPGPLLEAIRLVRESDLGDTIAVIAGDPAAEETITTWVRRAGHRLEGIEAVDGGWRFSISRSR
jgi:TusA-related sulfurtransferase